MRILKTTSQCRKEIGVIKKKGLVTGIVPTMGYLHEGHLSLARTAKKQCQKVFMTIFVNPAQFGPGEDFEKYPRDIKRDNALAEENGVDYIFRPSVEEIYKKDHETYVEVEDLPRKMCGERRPGHFRGVATVVLKLFNIIPAHRAYFGEKDYQQLAVIRKMVRDLDIDIKIIGCPTVREKDGLALSSRNRYLSPQERKNAAVIYKVLKKAKKQILGGEEDPKKIKVCASGELEKNPYIKKVEYFDIRDAHDLTEIKKADRGQEILIAAAAWIGNTRLIDNVVIRKKK
jgi:pantoate--beta-alanine ligase